MSNAVSNFVDMYAEKLYMAYSSMHVDDVINALQTSLPKTDVEREMFKYELYRQATYKATKRVLEDVGVLI